MAATANFFATDRGDSVYCAEEFTRPMATPTTADWEEVVKLGETFEKQSPGFDCITCFKKRRANLNHIQIQIGQVAGEHATVPQEDTQLQDLIS